jgi:hypothetical protein
MATSGYATVKNIPPFASDLPFSKTRVLVFHPNGDDNEFSSAFLIELGELIRLGKRALDREAELFEKKRKKEGV